MSLGVLIPKKNEQNGLRPLLVTNVDARIAIVAALAITVSDVAAAQVSYQNGINKKKCIKHWSHGGENVGSL